MANSFLGSFVTVPYHTASVHRVGDVTLEIALVPTTIRTIQVFVHRQDPGDGQLPEGRLLTNADLAKPGTGYSLHAINIPPCLAIDTSREVAVLRLADQEKVEDTLPEPEQERALQGPEGEPATCDPGIGGLGPFPDAGPDEVEVVEGVRGEAEDKAWKLAFDLGAMLSEVRGILDDLQIASSKAIDDCAITSGRLIVDREMLKISVMWDCDGAALVVQAGVSPEEG